MTDPFLIHALLCETILVDERTQSPSYINTLDAITITGKLPEYSPTGISFKVAACFRAATFAGQASYSVSFHSEGGKPRELSAGDFKIAPNSGANFGA